MRYDVIETLANDAVIKWASGVDALHAAHAVLTAMGHHSDAAADPKPWDPTPGTVTVTPVDTQEG